MSEEYTEDLQKLYLEFLLADKDLFVRCNAITSSKYFARKYQPVMDFIQSHVDGYGDLPTHEQIKAKIGQQFDDVRSKITDDHKKWFMDEYEKFCRHKALEGAILESADKLERHEYGSVEKLIKDAVSIGLAKDFGLNYWEDPAGRIQNIKNNRGQNSTGWLSLDKILYGGFNPGELNIFAGGSGSGKSLFMQNMALNWSLAGKNVVYVSLELSEELCSMRIDAMLTNQSTKDVMRNADDTALKVRMASKKAGVLQMIQMPNGTTVNDIKAYIKEFQIQHNTKVDALLVDYLDLMMPVSVKVNPSDQFIKDKYVSEELRNLAIELNILFVTASQLNRGAVDEVEFDHSHIAGGISKINTADNLIGIFSSRAMRERSRVQIQFMKTRSSSGVGSKLDLGYDMNTLRITDLDEDEQGENGQVASIYQTLKNKSTVSPAGTESVQPAASTTAAQNADRLKNLLKRRE
jgi:archaellum biogenesis ATPase FlaH|tara:strand:+ start:2738 stop:4129 length:1392 start_codon:yes stop_codon:yes gene_type:complete